MRVYGNVYAVEATGFISRKRFKIEYLDLFDKLEKGNPKKVFCIINLVH